MTRAVTYDQASPQRSRPTQIDHEIFVHFESIQTGKNPVIDTISRCTAGSRHRSP
jgi:hypothetical protein